MIVSAGIEIQQLQKTKQTKMSRSIPWRNKPTSLITQMLPVAAQMKLYLVNEIGPTSFLFKDENENKFKVVIGSKISCSCGIVENDHCIHTLFVMLKKFQVPETNPIIWQASYLDSELEGLIQLKYRQKKKAENTSNFKPRKKINNNLDDNDEDFPPLDQDITCPICYEDMVNQCYSTCSTCKKSMHSKCLKVWVRHKQDHGQSVTCPMCRSEFLNPLTMVQQDLQRWEKRYTIHKGTVCKACGVKNIRGLIYKCLICPNTDVCKLCYEGNQHLEHDKFFVKEMANQNWKIAPIRIKKTRHQLFQMIKQLQTGELPSNINSPQFILSLFPTLKQFNGTRNVNQLGIIGNEMFTKQICYKCRNIGDEYMKRLNCGHSVHQSCLRDMIDKKDYLCQVDQQPICPGYLAAIGAKVKPNKKAVMADVAFMRAEEESNKIKQRLGAQNIGLGFGVKVERLNERTKDSSISNKHDARSKDKNFRIMKRNILERKAELDQLGVGVGFGPMLITGYNHSNNTQVGRTAQNIPKPPSQGATRSRTLPRPL